MECSSRSGVLQRHSRPPSRPARGAAAPVDEPPLDLVVELLEGRGWALPPRLEGLQGSGGERVAALAGLGRCPGGPPAETLTSAVLRPLTWLS